MISYVDDTVILLNRHSWYEIETTVQNHRHVIKKLDKYQLSLNVEKLTFLKTYVNRPIFDLIEITNFKYNIYEINYTNIKYLGIIIKTNLKWDTNIQ